MSIHYYHHAQRALRKIPGWIWLSVIVLAAFCIFVWLYFGVVHALNTSAKHAGTLADNTPITTGTFAWTNPGNAASSNNSYATSALANAVVSHYLNLSNFGFTTSDIPTGSTINGIVANVERNGTVVASRCHIEDNSIKIMKGSSITGSTEMAAAGTQWPTSDTVATYGSSSNLWGQTWAVSDITATGFGIVISAKNIKDGGPGSTCTASIDDVTLTIYYTPPPSAYNQAAYRLFNNSDSSSVATFAKSWGGTSSDQAVAIVQTPDGGYATTGITSSFQNGSQHAYIARHDASGNLLWSKTWGGTVADTPTAMAQTSSGGFAITGQTSNFGAGAGDAFIVSYASDGTFNWAKTWGGTSGDTAFSITATSDGGYALTGGTSSFGAGFSDAFIAKYTSSGTLSWSKTWGGASDADQANAIIQTSDGGYAISGVTRSFGGGGQDAFIAKYTSSGTLSWSKTWGGASSGNDIAVSLIQTSDGGYAVAGNTASFGAGVDDGFIAKYTSSGTLSWSKTWGGTNTDTFKSIVQTSDGGYAVGGYTNSFGNGNSDSVIAKYNSSGTLSWSRTWGGSSVEQAKSIIQTPDGGYAVAGYVTTGGYTAGVDDEFILKYDSSGNISGCSTICKSDTVGGGSDYTSTNKSDTVGGGSDYTSTNKSDTVGGGSDYTSTNKSDTVGGGSDYTSTNQSDGSDFTSTREADTAGGGADYTSTVTVVVAIVPTDIDVGSALAAANTSATIAGDAQPFRLRIDIGVSTANLAASGVSLKLQYSLRSGTCDTGFSGESYTNVTGTTVVRYYDNTTAVNGLLPHTNASDPTDGGNTLVRQTYQEINSSTFTNPVAINTSQDGVWDFALTTDHTNAGDHYCLRIVKSDGSTLDTYTQIPEIILPSSTFTQSSYRLFNAGSAVKTFAKAWGGSSQDGGISVVQTSDGGYAVTGYTSSVGAGSDDVFLDKYDSSGTLTWNKVWGGTGIDEGLSVVQTADGGYAVAGYTRSFGAGNNDIVLLKYDSSGTLTWNKVWGGTGDDYGESLVQTSDGGYAVAGITSSFGAGSNDAVLLKYDSSGTLTWNKVWGGTGDDDAYRVVQTSDGGYALTGTTGLGLASNSLFLAKYDSSGTLSWNKTLGNTSTTVGESLVQTSDGGYAISGQLTPAGSIFTDSFLAKYNSSGNLSWAKTVSVGSDDSSYSLVQTSDGGYAMIGLENLVINYKTYLLKLTSAGSVVWGRDWGGSSDDTPGSSFAQTADGGYIITGQTNSFGAGTSDVYLTKYDASGNINGCSTTCGYVNAFAVAQTGLADLSPTATTSSPSATTSSPSATTSAPSATATNITSLGSSASVGSAIVAQNTPYDGYRVTSQFRLRLDLDVSGSATAVSGQAFKLQYALRGSDLVCDTSFTNESYADVTTTTPVYYYDGSGNSSGDGVSWSTNDPTSGSSLLSPQTYVEANNFNNDMMALYAGESGEWDFSLAIKSGTQPGNDYCLRVVTSGGSTISYNQIVDIGYGPSMLNLMRQEAWFNRSGVRQNFFIKGQ